MSLRIERRSPSRRKQRFIRRTPVLDRLGKHIRILAAIVDSVAAGRPEMIESAMLAERRFGDGWNESIKDSLMRRRGWRNAEDIWNEAGIPERRWQAHLMDLSGATDREIASYYDIPVRTVEDWLYRDRGRLKRLDIGDLGMVLGDRTSVLPPISEGA